MATFRRYKKSSKKDKENFLAADTGKKKQLFVRWLMKRGVSLQEAKNICHKKFYHGDPFENSP